MQSISLKSVSELQYGVLFTKILPPIVSIFLVILLANNLASLTWLMVPSKPVVPVPVTPTAIGANATSTTNVVNTGNSGMQVSGWHLFGVVPKDEPKPVVAPPPVIPQEAPDTTLHLTLKGVVASRDMMSAWAIIADRMGNEENYGVDDPLPDGAVLKEIYSDRIILLHNGRFETLRLPENDMSGVQTESPVSRRANNRRSSQSTPTRTTQVPTGAVNHLSYEASQVVKSYKEKLLSDPQSVMNTLRAEPYRQGGQLKGYRIFPGQDKQLFGQVGLEPGDVVTAVNGIELDSPLKGLEVMQTITDATEVSVNVLRNGVTQTYVVPLN